MKQLLFKNNDQIDFLNVTKVFVVTFIVFSVFFDFNNKLKFFDKKITKIISLLLVLGVMYYDLHTGILLTIAFLIIVIQLNSNTLNELEQKKLEMFLSLVPAEYNRNEKNPEHMTHIKKTLECDNVKKNEISKNIFDYSVDPKVKPYEVFIKMATTKQNLDNASNSAFLQPEPEDLL